MATLKRIRGGAAGTVLLRADSASYRYATVIAAARTGADVSSQEVIFAGIREY